MARLVKAVKSRLETASGDDTLKAFLKKELRALGLKNATVGDMYIGWSPVLQRKDLSKVVLGLVDNLNKAFPKLSFEQDVELKDPTTGKVKYASIVWEGADDNEDDLYEIVSINLDGVTGCVILEV